MCAPESKIQMAWIEDLIACGVTFKEEDLAVTATSIFEFTAKDIDDNLVDLSKFAGNVLIVVNVASFWGLTPTHYEQLQALYDKYHDKGLEILAFPCNQFGRQEPGSAKEIKEFVAKYNVTFPIFAKVHVNGKHSDPIFNFLRKRLPGTLGASIKWNFTKVCCHPSSCAHLLVRM